ncbi:HAAS signaling domain-containing protein [Actinoplanes sp. NPDC020271]|uniref:HAAS signaling domain-containing protein n=1 Tax=Actinoplanes sp. NPDC020271 TaxID=3363896 RepID=UPI0037A16ED5
MKPNQTDLVGEYLHEVDLRLSGLPLLQRRELLADLAAHIATERTDRNVQSEGELIEILERLGSPEVVAAAAYEEAGTPRTAASASPPPFTSASPPPPFVSAPPQFAPIPPDAPKRPGPPKWIFAALAVVGVVIVLCLGAALVTNRSGEGPAAPAEATVAPAAPTTPATPPTP